MSGNDQAYLVTFKDGRKELIRATSMIFVGSNAQFTLTGQGGSITNWTIADGEFTQIEEVPSTHRFILADVWDPGSVHAVPVKVRRGSRKTDEVEEEGT